MKIYRVARSKTLAQGYSGTIPYGQDPTEDINLNHQLITSAKSELDNWMNMSVEQFVSKREDYFKELLDILSDIILLKNKAGLNPKPILDKIVSIYQLGKLPEAYIQLIKSHSNGTINGIISQESPQVANRTIEV